MISYGVFFYIDFFLVLDSPYKWSLVATTGALVFGRYGHSATYDSKTNNVYIYGGYFGRNVTSQLLVFHHPTASW